MRYIAIGYYYGGQVAVYCRRSAFNLSKQFFLASKLLDAVRSVDVLQFLDDLLLSVTYLLYVLDSGVVHLLFDGPDDVVTLVERVDLRVELVDLVLAVRHELSDVVLVLDDCLRELHDVVVTMFVERAHDADARVTRLAVEANHLIL